MENEILPKQVLDKLVNIGIINYVEEEWMDKVILYGDNASFIYQEIFKRDRISLDKFSVERSCLEEGVKDGVWRLNVDELVRLYQIGCNHRS